MKTRNARNTALKLSALGIYAGICAIAACSSDPSAPSIGNHAGATGAGAPGAGAPGAGAPGAGAPGAGAPGAGAPAGGDTSAGAPGAGAPGAGTGGDTTAGAPGAGTAGAFVQPPYVTVSFSVDNILWVADAAGGAGGAGGTGGTGGTGGAAGGGAGGTGGAAAGAAGTAGTASYCETPGANFGTLPYVATKSFIGSDYQPNGGGNQIVPLPTACTHYDAACGTGNDNKGPCGQCTTWSYTPNPTSATYAGVGYVRKFDGNFTAPQICMPPNATAVTFYAKGAAGGEKVTFTAQGAQEVPLTLTNAWAKYSIPLTPGSYNSDTGVEQGFYWKVVPYVN